ncbi:MAG TPA: MFS transporter [Bryobacteraceae bacterium]|nr:MFS transporter [Bryobacteraceae bacterium]
MLGRIRGLRWWVIFTCFLATTINYLDRQCLSVTAAVLSKEFGLSNADYSSIITFFLFAYTLMQAVSGRIIDRIGVRTGMALSILIWSFAGILHAFAQGLWSLRIFRFLLGFGEAGNWPAATKVVSEWFPGRERALAVAIFDSGSAVGGIVAAPLIAALTLHYGWRPAFLITGSLGLVWLWLWLWIYRKPEEHPRITKEELQWIRQGNANQLEPQGAVVTWTGLLRVRAVWGVILGRFLTDCVWWFYVYWLPKYLADVRGFTLSQIGAMAWIPFVAVDLGNVGSGWISGRLMRRGFSLNAARKAVLLLAAAGMVAALPAGTTASAALCLGLIAVACFSYAAWGTMMLTLPCDLFDARMVASVSGLSGMGAGLGGILFTWAIGVVVDRFSYQPIFVAAGLLPLLAMLTVQCLIPEVRRMAGAGAAAHRSGEGVS